MCERKIGAEMGEEKKHRHQGWKNNVSKKGMVPQKKQLKKGGSLPSFLPSSRRKREGLGGR